MQCIWRGLDTQGRKKAPIWLQATVLNAKDGLVVIGVHTPEYGYFGEGDYTGKEQVIQGLLEEAKIAKVAVRSAIQTVGR